MSLRRVTGQQEAEISTINEWPSNIFLVGLNMNLSRFCVLPKGMQTPSFMGVGSVRIFVICYLKATTQSRFNSLLFLYSGGFCVLK